MTTRETVQGYFDALQQKGAWHDFLANDMRFTSFATPVKRAEGKNAFLEATKRFYSIINSVEIEGFLVDGARACVLTRYNLRPPVGAAFDSHVAEIFEVRNGKIIALDIYFDTAPFPK